MNVRSSTDGRDAWRVIAAAVVIVDGGGGSFEAPDAAQWPARVDCSIGRSIVLRGWIVAPDAGRFSIRSVGGGGPRRYPVR
mmetsp:Transcript_26941/g.79601  ORF Transcript_26941/g.79601 Transcript_26941/m.79601 type:complete len:81 (+) Transcript_26941:578-820(+)